MGLLIQNTMAMRGSIFASVFWSASVPIGWAPINATQSMILQCGTYASVFWSSSVPIGWGPINATKNLIYAPTDHWVLCHLALCGYLSTCVRVGWGVICPYPVYFLLWSQNVRLKPCFGTVRDICHCILILLCTTRLRANNCNITSGLCSKRPPTLNSLSLGIGLSHC